MPLLPGIPALPPGVATPLTTFIASEVISSLLWQASKIPPAWGIFDSAGNVVLEPDSFLDFTNRQAYEISKYVVQAGSFASYNKVIEPFDIQLRMSKGSTQSDRAAFLDALDALCASIDLFTVVTPERVYADVNFYTYELNRRDHKDAYFFRSVDLYGEEILQTQAQYTTTAVQLPNASTDSAQPTDSVGTVQPQVPTTQEALDGQDALGSLPLGAGGY